MKESDLIYLANQYLKMEDKAYLMSYKFDVKEENLRTMNQFLVNYRKKIAPDINHESVLTYREAFEETFHLIQIIGIGLSGIVGLIGLINFVMTMIYNIRSRRNELAMLERNVYMGRNFLYYIYNNFISYIEYFGFDASFKIFCSYN